MFTVTGLRVVREVAATGSFSAAAETLGYTQSAISRQVAVMEKAAGSPLFVRGPRGVTVSPAGAVLVRHATTVLAGLDAAAQELAGLRDRLAGRLPVGAFPTAASVLLPRAIADLAGEHPGLTVALHEESTPELLNRLRTGRIAVAVIGVGHGLQEYDLSGLRRDRLLEDDLRIAVPDGHRLAPLSWVDAAELAAETWIVGTGAKGDPQFGAWPTLAEPRIGYAVKAWPTRLGMVAAGLGIAVLPGLAAASVPAGVRVVQVRDATWRGRSSIALTETDRSPAATAMVQALLRQAHQIAAP